MSVGPGAGPCAQVTATDSCARAKQWQQCLLLVGEARVDEAYNAALRSCPWFWALHLVSRRCEVQVHAEVTRMVRPTLDPPDVSQEAR